MSDIVLIRALKHTLDGSEGGYGFISPFTIIEADKNKAADLVRRGIFEYVNIGPTQNYFTKVEKAIQNKVVVSDIKSIEPQVIMGEPEDEVSPKKKSKK